MQVRKSGQIYGATESGNAGATVNGCNCGITKLRRYGYACECHMVLCIYVQYVLFTRASELIVLEVPSPQLIKMVPEVVITENAVMVVPRAGVSKVQNPPADDA